MLMERLGEYPKYKMSRQEREASMGAKDRETAPSGPPPPIAQYETCH